MRSPCRIAPFVIAALLALAAAARAQEPAPAAAPPASGADAQAAALLLARASAVSPCPPSGARVTDVRRVALSGATERTRKAKLRDTIEVTVQGLDGLLEEGRCLERVDGRERGLVLYLDGYPLPDLEAYPPTDPRSGVLQFPLRRTEESRETWAALLGKPRWRPRTTTVSVGVEDRYAIDSEAALDLYVLPHGWFVFWALLFGAIVIVFWVLAYRSDVVRDPVSTPGGARRPYSLARVQAAWWFFVVLASYLFIGMVTGDYATSITGTVIVLLGISAGTTVGSAFVDASKDTPDERALQAATVRRLETEVEGLGTGLAAARALSDQAPEDPAKAQALADAAVAYRTKRSQLRKLRNESEGWLLDVLSDANGVNFHRFQMAAWTIVLGIIFAVHVYRDLAMPQFSTTLLSLMGISAGTYVGLKIPETTVPAPPPPPAPPAQP